MNGGVAAAGTTLLVGLLAAAVMVPATDASEEPVATLAVSITGSSFSPPDIIVLKGSKVTWTNKDSTVHTATSQTGGTSRDSFDEVLAPSSAPPLNVQDFTFNNVGKVSYTCRVHPTMLGSVTIVEKFDEKKVPIVNVTVDDAKDTFIPSMININATQSVNWTNTGTKLHDVTFENATIGALGDLKAGGTVSHTFTGEGTYAYRCKYHSSDFRTGMFGYVAVGANSSLPVLIEISSPTRHANVNGNVTIAGTTNAAFTKKSVSGVEVLFDAETDWKAASGIESWTLDWNTASYADGPHVIHARAISDGAELGRHNITVHVANSGVASNNTDHADHTDPTDPSAGGGSPGPGVVVIAAALVWAARRRRK